MADVTTDHDTIRTWAESKGGKPAAVDRTHHGGDVGIIRIMFPDNPQSEHGSLVEISWDAFFEQFESSKLALLYDEKSLFSKIVGRDTAERREHGDHDASRHAGRDSGGQHGAPSHRGEAHDAGGKGSTRHGGAGAERKTDSAEDESLKAREYRDADGNIHHHTTVYEKQHGETRKRD